MSRTSPRIAPFRFFRLVVLAVLVVGLGATPLAAPAIAHPHPDSHTVAQKAWTGADGFSVHRLYHAYFRRTPDAGGLAYWQQQASRGMSLSNISQHFASSAEFRNTYGHLDNAGFVTLVYRNVLDREPDPTGFAHWTGVLAEGRLSRGGVMIGFSDSAEFKARTGLIGTRPSASPPAEPAAGPSPNTFTWSMTQRHDQSQPVRWDPCTPVRVAADPAHGPAHLDEDIRWALSHIRETTGMDWQYVGSDNRARSQAQVQVRFLPRMNANSGIAWTQAIERNGQLAYTSAEVDLAASWASREVFRSVLLHEFGHAVGLGHTTNPDTLMYPVLRQPMNGFHHVELEGLRILGHASGCIG